MPFNTEVGSEGVFVFARREKITDGCRTAEEVDTAVAKLKVALDAIAVQMKAQIEAEVEAARTATLDPFTRRPRQT